MAPSRSRTGPHSTPIASSSFSAIVQDKEGQNRYLMRRENKDNNEDDLKKAYRRMDICRLSGVNIGDIVRISNVQTVGQFRAFKASAKTNSEFRNRTAQEWSSSLFMVTHLKGDQIPEIKKPVGETATVAAAIAENIDAGGTYGTVPTLETKALFDEPGVSPGIFLTPVWEAWKPYGKQKAVFGQDGKNYDGSGGLWWESMQSLSYPTNGRPHSLGYYLAQQERIAIDPVKYYDKDRFRGFQGEDLARVDVNTQERFAPYHGPDIRVFIGNALDPNNEFAHEEFIDNKKGEGEKNTKAPKIYGRLNAVIEPNQNRQKWMERNAEKYSACIHKVQRSVATVSRAVKKGGASPVLSLIARCVLEECLRTFSICSVHGQPIRRGEGGCGHLRVLDVIAEACDDPWSADVLHPSAASLERRGWYHSRPQIHLFNPKLVNRLL